jgi:hypothetical protein
MFGRLKKVLKGLWIQVAENIKPVVLQWFQQQPREFFAEGIHHLVLHSATCHSTLGDYF